MRKLLVVLDPLATPNRSEYLMCLAEANQLDGVLDVCKILDIKYSTLMRMGPETLKQCLLGKLAPSVLSKFQEIRNWGRLKRVNVPTDTRVCTICIGEGRALDSYLDFSIPIPCPLHNVIPLDACPVCKAPVSYLRRHKDKCNCGFVYADADRQETPNWYLTALQTFWPDKESDDNHGKEGFGGYTTAQAIMPLITSVDEYWNDRLWKKKRISFEEVKAIERVLSNWPSSCIDALRAQFERAHKVGPPRSFYFFHIIDSYGTYRKPLLNQALATWRALRVGNVPG